MADSNFNTSPIFFYHIAAGKSDTLYFPLCSRASLRVGLDDFFCVCLDQRLGIHATFSAPALFIQWWYRGMGTHPALNLDAGTLRRFLGAKIALSISLSDLSWRLYHYLSWRSFALCSEPEILGAKRPLMNLFVSFFAERLLLLGSLFCSPL